jgi:TolB-like protein/class 3 adenylate cyclase/cytochrome c-type biogenesis protein CcmH/NrfG
MERRLAAIMAADVVGYSRLIELDEAGTLAALKDRRRSILTPLVAEHHGRIVKVMGDGVLVEFASAVNAVQCAVELQKKMAAANDGVTDDRHIVLRVGVNLGDVIVEGGDLYGDGVIIAVRLEAMAEPGGVCLAGSVQEQVGTKLPLTFDDLGPCEVKNIAKPVRAFHVRFAHYEAKPPTASQSAQAKPSIAVLPFTNMSGDPEQQYFSDGITEDIITELSRFRSLFVIARNSSFQYGDKSADVKRVGRELGVRFVVEGSVRKLGSRLRVTAQLIDAETGNHIWADRYDRDLHDVFVLQDDLVHAVVATVSGRVDAAGRDRTISLSPDGLKAYDLHLRAKALYLKYTKSDNEQARIIAQRAMKIDPNNALIAAYYALYCYTDYISDWVSDLDQSLNAALEFAKRAVSLHDADAQARAILAIMYVTVGNFAEARVHAEKGMELNSNDSETRGIYGYFLVTAGEPEKAIEQFEIVRRHNPFDISYLPWIMGQAYFGARRYEEAIATFNQAHESSNEVKAWLAASNALAGHIGEAKAKLQEFLRRAEQDMVHFPGQQTEQWEKYLRRSFPYKDQRDFEHVCEGMRRAGLPV